MHKKLTINNLGAVLLEVVVALGIFALLAATSTALLISSLSLTNEAASLAQAGLIAQEGLEAVRSVRDQGWANFRFTRTGLGGSGGAWALKGEDTSDYIDGFWRQLEFEGLYRDANDELTASSTPGAEPDPGAFMVTATVGWRTARNATNTLKRSTYLANYRGRDWIQTDWSGGSGQSLWLDESKYQSGDSNIDTSESGFLKLVEAATSTYASSGYLVSSAFDSGGPPAVIAGSISLPPLCGTCAVRLFIQSAPDNGGSPGEWSQEWCGPDGEDGDETDYFVPSERGQIVSADHLDGEWLRYRIELTGEPTHTPMVEELRVEYNF